MRTLRVYNPRILRIKDAKLSGYYFYVNLNIWGDFQICISAPLRIASVNVTSPQETADLIRFTEEILTGKLHFLCSAKFKEKSLKYVVVSMQQ